MRAAYDLRWDDVAAAANALDARDSLHPSAPFLRGMATHWRILIDLTNAQYDGLLMRQMDEVVRRAEARLKRNANDFDARFFRSAALGFQGRLEGNRTPLRGRRAQGPQRHGRHDDGGQARPHQP